MTEIAANTKMANNKQMSQWLFNPFRFIAGFQALVIGLAIILIGGFIGWLGNTHFDGVLDVHIGLGAPLRIFLAEGLINWGCMAIPLFFFGLIVSHSAFRVIDVFGTQALARWPYIIVAIAMLPDANRRVLEYIMSRLTQTAPAVSVGSIDVFVFAFAMIVGILTIIWVVALMYRAYAVSCNIKGAKAIITFIISLIGAEVLSKFAILSLLS
jgi:hypothetical protein